MPTVAQRDANRRQDATRKRDALWLYEADYKQLDFFVRHWKLPNRIEALRRLMEIGRAAVRKTP